MEYSWIFTDIYPKNQPNVGKYAIHGASGIEDLLLHFSPVLENAASAEILSFRGVSKLGRPVAVWCSQKRASRGTVGGWAGRLERLISHDPWENCQFCEIPFGFSTGSVFWACSGPTSLWLRDEPRCSSGTGSWFPTQLTRPGGPSRWPRGQEAAAGGEGHF
jgi:hypothetical protein